MPPMLCSNSNASPRTTVSLLALAGVFVALTPSAATAIEIKLTAQLDSTVEYNDNILLSNTNKTSATSFAVNPQVTVSGENERNKISLTGTGRVERFDGISNRDVNDYGVSFTDSYAASERLTLGANASYNRESLLRAEIQDTGLIALQGHRTTITGGGNIGYKLSDTDQISLSGGYSDQSYSSALLFDYADYQASVAWQRQLSDRVSLTTSLSGAIEEPNSPVVPRSRYGQGTLGLNYALSEVASVGAYAGANYVESSLPGSGKVGVSAGGDATLKYEFTTLTASVSYGISPSGVGQLTRSTTATVGFSRQLDQHLYVDAGADIRFNKPQSNVLFSYNRRYYDGSASLRWEFARHFGLAAYYRYSRQRLTTNGLWASANTAGVHLVMYSEPRE